MSGVSPVIRFEASGYDSRLAIDRNQWPLGLLRASRPRWEFDVATSALDGDLPLHWQMERDMQPSHPCSARAISLPARRVRRSDSSPAPRPRRPYCDIPGRGPHIFREIRQGNGLNKRLHVGDTLDALGVLARPLEA